MCNVTVILPQDYPKIEHSEYIRPLTDTGTARQHCFLDEEKLVWPSHGYYYQFSYQPRKLILNAISDYNPLVGLSPQSMERALSFVAMDTVEKLVIKRRKYKVQANTGNLLLKGLRRNLNKAFFCNPNAVKTYFGPLPAKAIGRHYRQLISLAEEAIINPSKLLLVASDTADLPRKTLVLIGKNGTAFKCRLTERQLRINQAAKSGSFSVHQFKNRDIKITTHCLERFATRILGQDLDSINPLVTETELFKFIKNKAVNHSCLMRKTAFINISGCIFIGIINRGKLDLVTTYRETQVEVEDFHRQVLTLLQGKEA